MTNYLLIILDEQIVVIIFEDRHDLSGDSLLKINLEQEFNQNEAKTETDEKYKIYSVKIDRSKLLT